MTKDQEDILQKSAIAIQSDAGKGETPHISAKGKGYVAEKILDIAFAEGVKVRRDADLTNILDAFEVDSPVPLEALHTVGLILERVYEENRRLGDGPPKPTDTASASMSSAETPSADASSADASPVMKDITPGTGDRTT